jgi:hypothetical protein
MSIAFLGVIDMEKTNLEVEFEIIKKAIEALNTSDISIKSISEFTGIGESAIKKFTSSETRSNTLRNHTANLLKKFLVENFRLVAEKLRFTSPEILEEIKKLNDAYFQIPEKSKASPEDLFRHDILVGRAYDFIYEMLGVRRELVQVVVPRLLGDFTLYRPGTVDNRLVISSLEFSIQQYSRTLEYSQVSNDKRGETRKADGPVLVMGSFVYLLGDIESGTGIEYMIFKSPNKASTKLISGLCMTLNHLGNPIMGPVLLERGKCDNPRVIDFSEFNKPEILSYLKMKNVDTVKSFALEDIG